MKGLCIRSANCSDIDAVYELNSLAGDVRWSREFCQSAVTAGYCFFVACIDSTVIGFIVANQFSKTGHIYNIVVSNQYKRMGIASLLLDDCCKFCSDASCDTIQLECRVSNHGAASLYLRNKFTKIGEDTGLYKDPVESAFVFEKKL